LPVFVYVISILVYILGQGIFIWAKRANAFFSTVVRIQKERGHTVCQDGPYGFVRHPGYVGGILYGLSGPLVLGSLWALIPTALGLVLVIIRTSLEDKTLQEELTGYVEYSQKVKYKLIPGIW
jgi:protein-S-isoprenylcysteine O-methyltransferase Ste14